MEGEEGKKVGQCSRFFSLIWALCLPHPTAQHSTAQHSTALSSPGCVTTQIIIQSFDFLQDQPPNCAQQSIVGDPTTGTTVLELFGALRCSCAICQPSTFLSPKFDNFVAVDITAVKMWLLLFSQLSLLLMSLLFRPQMLILLMCLLMLSLS